MNEQKKQMAEAAILYYKKNYTQQEIANVMGLTRQTVSKLLGDAVKENIVEIKIHNPLEDCKILEEKICKKFNINKVIVCSVSKDIKELRMQMVVQQASKYLSSVLSQGSLKIGVSWGRTVSAVISEFSYIKTKGNIVFPLFGATDSEESCFLSNEQARNLAEKTGAEAKYAWFPYRPDNEEDCNLLKKTSYYNKMCDLWSDIDVAIVGIGNKTMLRIFEKTFGVSENNGHAIGDIATHFFDKSGKILPLYHNTLCASDENLKNAKKTVAIACGDDKVSAIKGALKTGLVDVLITDEYTARQLGE